MNNINDTKIFSGCYFLEDIECSDINTLAIGYNYSGA